MGMAATALNRADYIVVDNQQAAQFFRSLARKGACQYEAGAMRWWLEAGLRLELVAAGSGVGEWRLFVQARRECSHAP